VNQLLLTSFLARFGEIFTFLRFFDLFYHHSRAYGTSMYGFRLDTVLVLLVGLSLAFGQARPSKMQDHGDEKVISWFYNRNTLC